MGLHFKVSNNLSALAAAMIEEGYADLDIFQPFLILTQTKGMNNWLTQEIASEIGIAMNVQYLQPAQFVADIYNLLIDQKKKTIARSNIDWLLFQALSEPNFKYRFPYQYSYFVENEQENELKKWELAAKVADLFDQYQIYRHNTMLDWNRQNLKEGELKFEWQYYLWNRIKEIAGAHFPDMTEMQSQILQALDVPEKTALLIQKYPKISLFGVSIITQFHLEIFYKLKDHIEFYFYLLNPAPLHLWEYDKSEKDARYFPPQHEAIIGNPLLTGWGKILQHTAKLLFKDDAIFNLREEINPTEPSRNTLLGKVQNDIYNNHVDHIHFELEDLADRSITITSVFTIHSEVETLYNYLLHTVSEDAAHSFTERDILIIVTDINKYAPYIKAVFENAPYRFNYMIADESIDSGDSKVGALMALLALEPQHFTAEHLLSLFDYSYIRKRFGITDTAFLRQTVADAGIRFGIENSTVDDTFLVSWQYGLKKLMYGICFAEETFISHPDHDFITMDVADSQASMQQLVRLTAFVEQLIANIQERKKPRNLNAWKLFIDTTVIDFLESPYLDIDEDLEQWLLQINHYDYIDELIQNNDITYEVFSTRLQQHISNETQSARFLNKGITFCSPLPFRSIPFEIIGFLGLHMDAFPRREKTSDFDLIKQETQLGDRNIKENDKHLFLESLLSAKSRLYLSYIGRSIKDNSAIPPSIVIDELLDYIQSGFTYDSGIDVRKYLIEQRPLQSYNAAYNKPESDLLIPNYFIRPQKPYPIQSSPDQQSTEQQKESITLRDLELFTTNPIQYYYNKALHIYFRDIDETIAETEVFKFDALSQAIISQQLLAAYLQDPTSLEKEINKHYLKAQLPLKNIKETALSQILKAIKSLGAAYLPYSDQPLQRHHFSITFDSGKKLEGSIANIADHTLFQFSLNKEPNDKTLIKWYIQYLVASAAGLAADTILFYLDQPHRYTTISQAEAKERLETLLAYTTIGKNKMLFFSSTIAASKKKVNLDNFENSLEEIVGSEYFYDQYTLLAVSKNKHQGKIDEYLKLHALLIKPLLHFEKINQ